jgi:hypothetical protein
MSIVQFYSYVNSVVLIFVNLLVLLFVFGLVLFFVNLQVHSGQFFCQKSIFILCLRTCLTLFCVYSCNRIRYKIERQSFDIHGQVLVVDVGEAVVAELAERSLAVDAGRGRRHPPKLYNGTAHLCLILSYAFRGQL